MEEGFELYSRLNDGILELRSANRAMRDSGMEYAAAERDYKAAKAKKILELRADSFPVTICQDVAMGCAEVANLRFDRDCAQVRYETDREYLWSIKLELRLLDAEIDRQTRGM